MQIMCNCIYSGVCLLQVVIYLSFVVLVSNEIRHLGNQICETFMFVVNLLCGIIKQWTSLSMLM